MWNQRLKWHHGSVHRNAGDQTWQDSSGSQVYPPWGQSYFIFLRSWNFRVSLLDRWNVLVPASMPRWFRSTMIIMKIWMSILPAKSLKPLKGMSILRYSFCSPLFIFLFFMILCMTLMNVLSIIPNIRRLDLKSVALLPSLSPAAQHWK